MRLRRRGASPSGAHGNANVGMSNDKGGEKPPPPKDQGFLNNANRFRVSRVLSISRMARAMDETVNIPLLSWCVTRRRSSDTAAS